MAIYTHHLPEWKREEVEQIKKLAQEYSLVGLVNIYGIPAKQFQQIRRNLHGSATVKVARNTLLNHAFTELGGNFAALNEKVNKHTALIFANVNPFKLYKTLVQNST